MGGKSKQKSKATNAKLDELPEAAYEARPHTATDEDRDAATDPDPKAKTWFDHQVERMRRAVQHNMLSAQVVRTNFAAAKLNEKQAESIAKEIEMHTQAARGALEEFLGRLPENFEGVTPSRTGLGGGGSRKGFLKGIKVRIKADAAKSFSQLFTVDELNDLTVQTTAGANVVLITASKAKLVVPSKKIEAIETKAA